jgi:hypothetical protein
MLPIEARCLASQADLRRSQDEDMMKKQKADFLWYTTAFMVGTTLVLIAFYEAIKLD